MATFFPSPFSHAPQSTSGPISSSDNNNPHPIQRLINEQKLTEAIKELLFLLLDINKISSDHEQTYDFLFQLFPHLDNAHFSKLNERLPHFLSVYSHLTEQQERLALLLAQWQLRQAQSLSSQSGAKLHPRHGLSSQNSPNCPKPPSPPPRGTSPRFPHPNRVLSFH